MTNSSSTFKQVANIWSTVGDTPIIAGGWSKFNLLQDQHNVRKPSKSCNTGSSSAAIQSTKQDIKAESHFGPHLLKNLKVGLDLKGNVLRKEYGIGNNKPVKPVKKSRDLCATMKTNGVANTGVLPFCEKLILGVQQNRKIIRQFRASEAMVLSTPHPENFAWSCPGNQTSCSFGGVARSESCQNLSPWMVTQARRLDTQLQPTEGAKQNFRELGLTYDQIIGLEHLGLNVSKFLPRMSSSYQHDPRIPPSFDFDGVSCYWCESSQHVAYGVAFILKEDARVVAVEVQRNKSSTKVALIQMATTDVVLLIPMTTNSTSAPKALQIIFRDPEIFKTGVQIKKNLMSLWVEFQIESNSFVELNELLELSRTKLGSFSGFSKRPMTLRAIASTLGYHMYEIQDVTFSN